MAITWQWIEALSRFWGNFQKLFALNKNFSEYFVFIYNAWIDSMIENLCSVSLEGHEFLIKSRALEWKIADSSIFHCLHQLYCSESLIWWALEESDEEFLLNQSDHMFHLFFKLNRVSTPSMAIPGIKNRLKINYY